MMRLLTRLLVPPMMLIGLIAVGCAVASDEVNVALPPYDLPPCTDTSQCSSGAICVDDVCMPTGSEIPAFISVELDPPESSGYARTQRLDIPVAELFVGDGYVLPEPTEYETVIHDADGAPISANLAIFGAPRIPGRELDVNATLTANAARPLVFRLLQGSYVVRIRPTSDALPGIEVTRFTVRPQTGRTVKEFRLPATYRRLFGEVTSSLSSDEKVAGVTVRAFGQKSGLPSTVSITGEDGAYELLLPDTEDTTFRLVATPPGALQPAWGFEQIVRIDLDEDRRRSIHLEPTDDSIRGTGRFTILGTTPDGRIGAPVINAFVSLTATVTGVIEPPVYEVTGITNADGVVVIDQDGVTREQVPLLKARYVLRVVPPVNTSYTSKETVLDLTSARNGFITDEQVTLPQRTVARGTVVSPLGRPVASAFVELLPLSPQARPADAVTEADGRFTADLDPGPYLLVVRPRGPTDAGELLPISARAVDIGRAPAVDLTPVTMPRGQEVRSVVRGGRDSEPVPGTEVEMFFSVAGQVVRLGRSETDSQGAFTMVVPQPNL